MAESIKGILQVKQIPFTRALHEVGTASLDLKEWTGQTSSPVLAWNDERPRTIWNSRSALPGRAAGAAAAADPGGGPGSAC